MVAKGEFMNKLFTFFRESQTARFLIPLGLMLTIFGVVIFTINSKNQNYIGVEAIVSKVELAEEEHLDANDDIVHATYKIYVKYNVDGKDYEEELGELSGDYKEGDKMTIYYNPNNPSEITQTTSLVLPIVIIIGGIAVLAGGIISGVNAIKRQKKMKEQEKEWAKNE